MKKKFMKTMFVEYPDVVDVSQLQKMLCIGRRSAYALLKDGTIRSVMIGNKYRISKVAVIGYVLQKQKTESEVFKGA